MAVRTDFLIALALVGAGVPAHAQGEDPAVAAARAAGNVGEQADGYLGFPRPPSSTLKAAVDAINIKRRAIYTDLAAKRGATVQEVAAARGCDQLRGRVADGEMYLAGGGWQAKSGPIALPGYCG